MRMARIKAVGEGYYHVMSRVIGGEMLLDEGEKERFRRYMRASEAFSGVQVLTYAILDNHFHLELYVPERREIGEEDLMERLGYLYKPRKVKAIARSLNRFRENGCREAAEELKKRYTCRMFDLSEYMKTVKQRFTQSYNTRHERKGTLWEEQRFKSILLEGPGRAVTLVGAYIDLNAIRAGLADDPKDYRFCGYGEAMGGLQQAQAGIGAIVAGHHDDSPWDKTAPQYRAFLYIKGQQAGFDENGRPLRRGFDPEAVQAVIDRGGELSLDDALRCRVRYFTDGVVLGGKAFVEDAFVRYRRHFGARRNTGALPMRGGDWGELYTAHLLRPDIITAPASTC